MAHKWCVVLHYLSMVVSPSLSLYSILTFHWTKQIVCNFLLLYIYKCRVSTERTCFFDIGGHCEIYNNHCWHQDVSSVRSLLKRSAFGNLFFAWAIIKAIVRLSEYEKKPPESKRNINDKLLVPDFVCL